MNGVTDHAFRQIQKRYGCPDVVMTEFTPVDGICAGADALLKDLLYDEAQRPILAQVYGSVPEEFHTAAVILCQLGFDGIDINMGCPSKAVASRGSGAALIRTPGLAQQIIRATKRGVADWMNGRTVRDCLTIPGQFAEQVEAQHRRLPEPYRQHRGIPVSVKTRTGYDRPVVQEWIPALLECSPDAIGIHGRTLSQGYSGEANWDHIGHAAELAAGSGCSILGNGDVRSWEDAQDKAQSFQVAGALIGRASYGNPHVFRPAGVPESTEAGGGQRKPHSYWILDIAMEHARLYKESFSRLPGYHFLPMRKHLSWYAKHVPSASYLRRALAQTSSVEEAEAVIKEYLEYRRGWND
jgi:nifR3 family TIM-barrel protein